MRHTLLTLALLIIASSCLAQEDKKVLFIGNSYTEVNSLPQQVQKVAQSAGDNITFESNTPGGCTFQQHCSNNSMTLIQQGGWDVVVLQEQSQLPSFPQSQVENECFPFAQQLVNAIYQYNDSTVEPMFYMTWGRKDGDAQNGAIFPPLATYEGMDSLLYERYMYMGQANNASVCPVGRVWHYIRDNYPDIELYQSDGSHPSMAGTYAAACAFYTMIFEKTPMNITHDAGLDETTALTIREVTKCIVFDNLADWKREGWGDPVSIEKPQQTSWNGPYILYNAIGQPVYRGTEASTLNLQTLSLPKGLYILRSTQGGAGKKMIKF